jgi:hypothetical protein
MVLQRRAVPTIPMRGVAGRAGGHGDKLSHRQR